MLKESCVMSRQQHVDRQIQQHTVGEGKRRLENMQPRTCSAAPWVGKLYPRPSPRCEKIGEDDATTKNASAKVQVNTRSSSKAARKIYPDVCVPQHRACVYYRT